MYASELRTCGLGAIVTVLLGAGIGVGWHTTVADDLDDLLGGREVLPLTGARR